MSGKTKRARERARMESERVVYERVEAWVSDMDNMPEGPYNSCNLQPNMGGNHLDDCEKDCQQITKWELALAHEKARWRKMGGDPNQINTDTFAAERRINVLGDLLIKAGITTEEELSQLFLKVMFTDLKTIRESVQPQVEAAKAQSKIQIAGSMPRGMPPRFNGGV